MESNDKLEQLIRQMYAQESLHEEDIDTSDIIDEEWAKFEAEHFNDELKDGSSFNLPIFQSFSSLKKIAAMFIGVLMLSGIAYAAIHIISNSQSPQEQQSEALERSKPSTLNTQHNEMDSTQTTLVVFENKELCMILTEVATFYQCETVYKSEKVKHVRLYFTWDKTKQVDEVLETFNRFDRFRIIRENQQLIVE